MFAPSRPYPGDLLDHLRAFSLLADAIERGGDRAYARAGRDLALDVSVLRRRVQTLAEHVDVPLTSGRGAGLRLTAAGVRARDHARRMLDLAASLRPSRDEEGPFRVACTGTILAEVLPGVLAAMRARHPRLRFRVRRAGADASLRLLGRDEIDVAIVRAGAPPAGVSARKLGDDRLWLAVPAKGPLARRRPPLATIAQAPLIGYPPTSATMRRVLAVLGPLGAAPWIEVDGKAAALGYVAAGLGVAFVSLLAGQAPSRPGVTVRDVTTLFPRVSFWLVWPPHATVGGFRETFVAAIVAARA
jgi:DNA-binding transcriptional LysR family regulator